MYKNNFFFIKYNYSFGTKYIYNLIKNYIYNLYNNKNNLLFFLKILIITFNIKQNLKIFNYIIYILNKIKTKKILISKKIHKKFNIPYDEIKNLSYLFINNILLYSDKIPIYTIDQFLLLIYKKKYSFYIKKNIFFVNKNIYLFLNYIFKKKNINNKYIKKYLLKILYKGYYKITNNFKKKIRILINSNKTFKNLNFKFINKKITKYIYRKKKLVEKIKKYKNKFYNFLKNKKIDKKSFIYNDIYNLFEKKINLNLIKKNYLNYTFLNNRLKNNIKK
ncbi:MAG: hypothetical protein NHF90_00240, partial [Candidatus Shikimatogenerans sp. JK-2022]|nr:hypothetical protein [Candidatus Shikimatogenerans bostrichidophilus]